MRVVDHRSANCAQIALPELSGVTTDGETYLTPAECGKSLLAIFKKYSFTQGKLAKTIGTNPGNVSHFMASGAEFGGAEKCCYHALAQFCEKVRIATGSKKSRKGLAIEAEGREHPYLGDDGSKRYRVTNGTNLHLRRDELGRHEVNASAPAEA